jgi:hypothetical protein
LKTKDNHGFQTETRTPDVSFSYGENANENNDVSDVSFSNPQSQEEGGYEASTRRDGENETVPPGNDGPNDPFGDDVPPPDMGGFFL